MGLLDSLRAWLSPDTSKSEPQKELRTLLIASMEIVGAYGAVVEKCLISTTPSIKLPETELPYAKQVIAQAIANVQHAIKDPYLRPMIAQAMEADAAKRVLSTEFGRFLAEGLVILEFFVPPSEVESDRKKWEEMLPLLDNLGPEARARYANLFVGTRRPMQKKNEQ